eukprot:TRINITY_DN8992_c0_g1_i1.p1 TRINITY_DN8992_c0_g1~~TRINITY_DN8992_c0_g1_i1.p1  ORF type:complete len:262 (+),score=20.24 TRINITY_DN8992_c0_g1_i1:42-788(+)
MCIRDRNGNAGYEEDEYSSNTRGMNVERNDFRRGFSNKKRGDNEGINLNLMQSRKVLPIHKAVIAMDEDKFISIHEHSEHGLHKFFTKKFNNHRLVYRKLEVETPSYGRNILEMGLSMTSMVSEAERSPKSSGYKVQQFIFPDKKSGESPIYRNKPLKTSMAQLKKSNLKGVLSNSFYSQTTGKNIEKSETLAKIEFIPNPEIQGKSIFTKTSGEVLFKGRLNSPERIIFRENIGSRAFRAQTPLKLP